MLEHPLVDVHNVPTLALFMLERKWCNTCSMVASKSATVVSKVHMKCLRPPSREKNIADAEPRLPRSARIIMHMHATVTCVGVALGLNRAPL